MQNNSELNIALNRDLIWMVEFNHLNPLEVLLESSRTSLEAAIIGKHFQYWKVCFDLAKQPRFVKFLT